LTDVKAKRPKLWFQTTPCDRGSSFNRLEKSGSSTRGRLDWELLVIQGRMMRGRRGMAGAASAVLLLSLLLLSSSAIAWGKETESKASADSASAGEQVAAPDAAAADAAAAGAAAAASAEDTKKEDSSPEANEAAPDAVDAEKPAEPKVLT
jgi:hypothetical protein